MQNRCMPGKRRQVTHQAHDVTRQQEMFSLVDVEQLITLVKQLEDAKRNHFLHLMTSLLDCFLHEGGQAVVMVKTLEGLITMAAVNADEHEVNGMVGLMSDALKARSGAMAHGQVN